MLHNINYLGVYIVPRGTSGRIVIEIDPALKDDLYETLQKEGINLKSWFLDNVKDYLSDRSQLKLSLVETTEQSMHK